METWWAKQPEAWYEALYSLEKLIEWKLDAPVAFSNGAANLSTR
jgi:hypothetical protein